MPAGHQTGRQPVVFVHGLWLPPSSWDRWAALFEEHGYVALTPGGRPLRHHLLVPKVALAGMAG